MKISDIVKARNNLKTLTNFNPDKLWIEYVGKVTHGVIDYPVLRDRYETKITTKLNTLSNTVLEVDNQIQEMINYCDVEIQSREKEYFERSQTIYSVMNTVEVDDAVLGKKLSLPQEQFDEIFARIASYSDWRFPAILIRPGIESIIDKMLASDPLYLLDTRLSLLNPITAKFVDQYRRRLRLYTCVEDDTLLSCLPNEQYNLAVVWNFFNYRTLSLIKKYLELIWQKLRPGGVVAFTFNDCEYANAVMLVEQNMACYTPGRLIHQYLIELGFKIIFEATDQGSFYWLEAQKPGTLSSLRGGQTLAQIIPKY